MCTQYTHTLHCTSRTQAHTIHCTYVQCGAWYITLHIYRSQELPSHIFHMFNDICMCSYILNVVGNIILNAEFWLYYCGIKWKFITCKQVISQNLYFHCMPITTVTRLERRAPILGGGSQESPKSSSLGIFWLAHFFHHHSYKI